jgi:hypothetical protein
MPMACPRFAASGRKTFFTLHGDGLVQEFHLLPRLDFLIIASFFKKATIIS